MAEYNFRQWLHANWRATLHWLTASLLILGGIHLGNYLDDRHFQLPLRYRLSQIFQSFLWQPVSNEQVVLVKIGDSEFWKGPLERRIPVKRDYLAQLVTAVAAAGPSAIAIDFNFRSPVPDGSIVETPKYAGERDKLVAAIDEAAKSTKVILPATFDVHQATGYALDSAIYSQHTFSGNVRTGFINFMPDLRRVPNVVPIAGRQEQLPSFSLAAALAVRPDMPYPRGQQDIDRYAVIGRFMGEQEFRRHAVAAEDILQRKNAAEDLLRHRIAIICAFYHKDAFGRGPFIDPFSTPGDVMPGAVVHANYIEAWLSSRVREILPRSEANFVEFLVGLAVSWSLLDPRRALLKFSLTIATVLALSYFLLACFGIFFEWYLPVVIATAHGSGEKIKEWRRKARLYDANEGKSRRVGT